MSSFNDVTVLGSAGTASPSVEYSLLSPMLIVFGVAVVGVLIEAFAPRRFRYPVQLVLGVAGLAAAFVAVLLLAGTRLTASQDPATGAIVVSRHACAPAMPRFTVTAEAAEA